MQAINTIFSLFYKHPMCTGCACPHCSCCCGCKCRLCRSTVYEVYEKRKEVPYPPHYVCWSCLKGWKVKVRGLDEDESRPGNPPRCPKCSKEGYKVGWDFRLPKQSAKKKWELAEWLYFRPMDDAANPVRRTYCPGCAYRTKPRLAYPKTMKEAIEIFN